MNNEQTSLTSGGDYRISETPVVHPEPAEQLATQVPVPQSQPTHEIDLGELPASYGSGALYLVGRDPRWIFAYWDVDWAQLALPREQLYLRLYRAGGQPASETLLRHGDVHWLLPVPEAGHAYFAEVGWFTGPGQWHALEKSGLAETSLAAASHDESATFASIPFHLTFERLLALIELAAIEGESLVETISRLQREGGTLDYSRVVQTGWTEDQRRVLEALLGEDVLERFSLDSLEIERLLRRGIQESGAHGDAIFSRERWDHLLHLAAGNMDLAGS